VSHESTGAKTGAVGSAHLPILGDDDELVLCTVGVDIGSATSQIVFSELVLERRGGRYETVGRTVRYESEILITPFRAEGLIDADELGSFFERQHELAGIDPSDVDTGALILTGVALQRSNADAIAALFAESSGRFVSVAAGDEIEARLAAFGSGAVAASRGRRNVLNVDIGGGTTKFAWCVDGTVAAVAAIDVGTRLIAWDENSVVNRFEVAAASVVRGAGLATAFGGRIHEDDCWTLGRFMASVVADAVAGNWQRLDDLGLVRLAPLDRPGPIDTVVLSGGVGAYATGAEVRRFGDLGPYVAAQVVDALGAQGVAVEVAPATIRATVVGASQFAVQVSGTTIHLPDDTVLPLRNVPITAVEGSLAEMDASTARSAIATAMAMTPAHDSAVAVALTWGGSPDLATLDHFCGALLDAVADRMTPDRILVVVIDRDVAGLVGAHLVTERGYSGPLIVVDGIDLRAFDFVDIGNPLDQTTSVVVTIKSLAFGRTGSDAGVDVAAHASA
jgi:ethanolamine utilization protein EutA